MPSSCLPARLNRCFSFLLFMPCCCRLGWWKHCAEYFPTQLIKTADLDPDQRYIFVVAPHGVVTMFCWCVARSRLASTGRHLVEKHQLMSQQRPCSSIVASCKSQHICS
jgi:hypothetical protein